MTDIRNIQQQLKRKGHRLTKLRKQLLQYFSTSTHPVTAKRVISDFRLKNITAHPSSFYRELEFLTKEKVVQQVFFKDAETHYELYNIAHHHHIVCKHCGYILPFYDTGIEESLVQFMRSHAEFDIDEHHLELFGTCSDCIKKI